ncbi:hypothetical protein MPTK1_4g16190 [Marchantia polymorpha subsp. ruderalis]|uniref:Uncharacterized protein n=2 Tax=Marchantia polymorpha TaxID=3197 RepID=A0AAF6BAF5_MARPO|nr:hypothetical protein MARPO_0054s0084 [Marchantia polymorpha]PTQ37977.1 hypothetical protein MARPO_0054s0084 [Marchantia polymorpha]BBN08989.1 hypothetical protein Mp_4g16190 [Marchantia polymorpha subsp. ruderalis]BBN08990.1 hypothetical protein Mp_4g16190 [Marchantia polymorpha subsp. ruderalis]|eukprot:PTQ37976.1 hypothetical protein MARPO_0054s0084 [Marchantia polymorpha]
MIRTSPPPHRNWLRNAHVPALIAFTAAPGFPAQESSARSTRSATKAPALPTNPEMAEEDPVLQPRNDFWMVEPFHSISASPVRKVLSRNCPLCCDWRLGIWHTAKE